MEELFEYFSGRTYRELEADEEITIGDVFLGQSGVVKATTDTGLKCTSFHFAHFRLVE
jgi:hypothetical protein